MSERAAAPRAPAGGAPASPGYAPGGAPPATTLVPVVVTGVGLTSSLGPTARATFDRLVGGERALRPPTLFDTSALKAKLAGEFDVADPALARSLGWSRTAVMALSAAREALAGLGLDPREGGLAFATSTSGMLECELTLARLDEELPADVLATLAAHPTGAVAERLDERLGPFAVRRTLCSACSAGSNALATGAAWLASGRVKWVLAGAADGLSRHTFGGFDALAAMSPEPSRPFDRARAGMTLGEAGAFVVLEREEDAARRLHAPLVWLAGYAIGCEALHITQPEEDGATVARLVGDALGRAGVSARDVDYVHAHGTGTQRNDPNEMLGLRRALGDAGPLVSSSKGALGHTLAAAGAVGAVVSTLALREGLAPPTAGLTDVAPECEGSHVAGASIRRDLGIALVNAFGFGGMDTVLALSRTARGGAPAPSGEVIISGLGLLSVHGLHGAAELATLLARRGGLALPSGAAPIPQALDPERARRFDRCARRLTLAALATGGGTNDEHALGGLVAGNACGAIDETAAYCKRWAARGGKSPDPLGFPALVPSSPAARTAIYLGLKGPVFSTHDLGFAAEEAALAALELCSTGAADAVIAGSYDELGPLLAGAYRSALPATPDRAGPMSDGASAVLFERRARAEARGARPLARVAWAVSGTGPPPLPPAPGRARRAVVRAHVGSPLPPLWEGADELVAAHLVGASDVTGGAALVFGAALAGEGASVLVTSELHLDLATDTGEPGRSRYWAWALEPA